MKANRKLVLVGAASILGGIWGGAWLMTILPDSYDFAAFLTGMLITVFGGAALFAGAESIARE